MDTIMFWLSKIMWAVFSPAHFFIILFLVSLFFIKSSFVKKSVQFVVAAFFLLMLLLPIGEWAMVPLEQCTSTQSPPLRIDGVIVLGGAVNIEIAAARNTIAFNDSAERVFALEKLLRQYPTLPFVYAGGNNSFKRSELGEADYIKQFLIDMGYRSANILFKNQSRNTYEDALVSKDIYAITPKQNWMIVTSAYHMPRALGLFEKMGEKTDTHFYPYTVDYRTPGRFKFDIRFDILNNLAKLNMAAHEYVGLIVNTLLGRSNHFMPCTATAKAKSI